MEPLLETDMDKVYMAEFYNQLAAKGFLTNDDFSIVNEHLERVSEARDKAPKNSSKQFFKDTQTFVFLDYLHLAFVAFQTRRVNSSGEQLCAIYMKKAEQMLPLLDEVQLEDHILHLELKFNIILMKILNVQQEKNILRRFKILYNKSKKRFKNCNNDLINCFSTRFYLETVFLDSMLRLDEKERTSQSFSLVQDLIEKHPQHLENLLVKYRLVIFYLVLLEIHMTQNNVLQVDRYCSKVLEMQPDSVFKALALHHRAFIRLAMQQTYITTQETKLIEQNMESAEIEWQILQNKNSFAPKHQRYLLFLISLNYNLYKRAEKDSEKIKYAEQIMQVFEESIYNTAISSLDFGNLNAVTTYLEVCFEMQKYDKILQFCDSFQKGKSRFNLRFAFRDILKVAMVTASVCKEITKIKNLNTQLCVKKLEQAMKLLEESTNWRKVFWFNCSTKLLYDLQKESGSLEKFHKFRSESNFYLPSFYDKCSLLGTGSGKSSVTSLMEVINIDILSLKFIYIEAIHFRDLLQMQSIFNETDESYEAFKLLMKQQFKMKETNFCKLQFVNEMRNWILDVGQQVTSSFSSYIIYFKEIAGLSGNTDNGVCLSTAAIYDKLSRHFSGEDVQIIWIIVETIVVGQCNYVAAASRKQKSKLRETTYKPLDCMLTSSSTNINSILELINKKTLMDCLRDSFASHRRKKELELYDIIKDMFSIADSAHEEYLVRNFETSDLNSKVYQINY